MKLLFVFCVGMMMSSLAFAGETYVNRFKLFNDFDKFLSQKASHYEFFPEGEAEFYADPKYSEIATDLEDKSYKDAPEFVLKAGKLFHKGKLICDIKDGYPVPVNEVRPDNLTERQKEMTICIYLPFVYYKKDFFNKSKKDDNNKPNYSIRVILDSWTSVDSIHYKGKTYYQKAYLLNDKENNYVSALQDIEENKKCRDKYFSDEQFSKDYNEAIACGLKKDLECLKKYLPITSSDKYLFTLKNAKMLYGFDINGKTDNDLLFFVSQNITVSEPNYSVFTAQYKELTGKISPKTLHRKIFADTVSRLFKLLPSDEFVCEFGSEHKSLTYIFYDKYPETISFYKDTSGRFRFKYSLNYYMGQKYRE